MRQENISIHPLGTAAAAGRWLVEGEVLAIQFLGASQRLEVQVGAQVITAMQAESEAGDKIDLSVQRHLINNLKLATELGAEVVKIKHNDVGYTIMSFAEQQQISTICLGKPIIEGFRGIKSAYFFTQLLKKLSSSPIDLILLS